MARIAKLAFAGAAASSSSFNTVATVPAGKKWEIVEVVVASDSGSLTVARMKTSGAMWLRTDVSAGTTLFLSAKFTVMAAGDIIELEGGSVVGWHISVIEVDV